MNFEPKFETQFRKDYKLCKKRNCNMKLLDDIMFKIQNDEPLDPVINCPHYLTGKNPRVTECHIQSDWVLEYRYFENTVFFLRTGSHSDLFK
ncbi:RelE/StbE family addiction module toxin [Clostridia bacterium]|nr:RelE/StbE family addiction module toxin [Clostridia bacterium]